MFLKILQSVIITAFGFKVDLKVALGVHTFQAWASLTAKRYVASVISAALLSSNVSAITIRDDVADSAYRNFAADEFAFTGKLVGPWLGSATLISPNWVITAKHVLNSTSPFTFSTVDGTSRSVVETVNHPTLDLALGRLSSNITNVDPVKLFSYEYGNDYGIDVVVAGAGMTGTGLTGQISGTQGTLRAAEQRALYHGDTWGGMWISDHILTQFRSPDRGAGLLEGGSAQGDSGGGLFIWVNGEYTLAGEMSLVWQNSGVYGAYQTSGGAYVNTAPYNDWITSYATNAIIIPELSTFKFLTAFLCIFVFMRQRRSINRTK